MTGVDAVASLLQRNCPVFFKEDDRLFYQVCVCVCVSLCAWGLWILTCLSWHWQGE